MIENTQPGLRSHNLDSIKASIAELSVEERARLAKDLFHTADMATRAEITTEGFTDMPRGILPFDLFKAVAWRTVVPTYEPAVMRPTEDGESAEILLNKRESEGGHKDWWEGQWHVPGTVMLASDEWPEDLEDFSVIRNRLFAREYNNAIEIVGTPIAMPTVLREGPRGKEVTVHELIDGRVKNGVELPRLTRFFDVRNVLSHPPDGGLVDMQDVFISKAAEKYLSYYQEHRSLEP